MSENEDILNEIDKWDKLLKSNNDFLEIAFFKIFVKFENFIVEMILQYASGEASSENYLPIRRLDFDDPEHLKNTIDTKYLDVSDKTKSLVDQIFDNNNPFSFFFDCQEATFFDSLRSVRNYIAHESRESKEKYRKKALFNKAHIEPNAYLSKRYKAEDITSNYTKFIELVKSYSELIIDMSSYEGKKSNDGAENRKGKVNNSINRKRKRYYSHIRKKDFSQ
ncbi:hypothetical protein [Listeria booriae]|uniref:hypothetical protein n=1 Tax=Listeria booriae TaxID=1552123 RepID=UPI00162A8214|nr:hypothetical protein [Listeria booriae]MBC1247360.1 hypothetical protein [Listeria booriae]